MLKLTIMRGLPGAGKSTIAATLVGEGTVRVNRDLLREMLYCKKLGIQSEFVVAGAEMLIARWALEIGKNVVVDDTNLLSIARWEELGRQYKARVVLRDVGTNITTCIEQDCKRGDAGGRRVGRAGIYTMAMLRLIGLRLW